MTAPAFPYSRVEFFGGEKDETKVPGLSKREYAAIHLMPSVILADDFDAPAEVLAQRAVALADAVLREAGE